MNHNNKNNVTAVLHTCLIKIMKLSINSHITFSHKNQTVLLYFFINIHYISTINLKNFTIT